MMLLLWCAPSSECKGLRQNAPNNYYDQPNALIAAIQLNKGERSVCLFICNICII